jgi:hypothetical protein
MAKAVKREDVPWEVILDHRHGDELQLWISKMALKHKARFIGTFPFRFEHTESHLFYRDNPLPNEWQYLCYYINPWDANRLALTCDGRNLEGRNFEGILQANGTVTYSHHLQDTAMAIGGGRIQGGWHVPSVTLPKGCKNKHVTLKVVKGRVYCITPNTSPFPTSTKK